MEHYTINRNKWAVKALLLILFLNTLFLAGICLKFYVVVEPTEWHIKNIRDSMAYEKTHNKLLLEEAAYKHKDSCLKCGLMDCYNKTIWKQLQIK